MIGTTRKMAALVGAVVIVGSIAGPAWAPKVFRRLAIPGATCSAQGVPAGTPLSGASIDFTHLSGRGDEILLAGVIEGTCGTVTLPRRESVLLSTTVIEASSQRFTFLMTPVDLELSNMSVSFSLTLHLQPSASTERLHARAAELYREGNMEAAAGTLNKALVSGQPEGTRQPERK